MFIWLNGDGKDKKNKLLPVVFIIYKQKINGTLPMEYKIQLKANVLYTVDEDDLDIETVDDIYQIENKYGVSLESIISEYEYKVEAEESYIDEFEEEDDLMLFVNKKEVLQEVVVSNMLTILDAVNKQVPLDKTNRKEADTLVKELLSRTNGTLSSKIYSFGTFRLSELRLSGYNHKDGTLLFTVSCDGEIDENKLDAVASTVENRMVHDINDIFDDIEMSDAVERTNVDVYVNVLDDDVTIQ